MKDVNAGDVKDLDVGGMDVCVEDLDAGGSGRGVASPS